MKGFESQDDIYRDLKFPDGFPARPYSFIDMVATIDGKILSGDRDETVTDLGSKFDHDLMKRIAAQADAVLVGAHTLRTTLASWDPQTQFRVAVSRSGDLPYDSSFFKTGRAFVACPSTADFPLPTGVGRISCGPNDVDPMTLMSELSTMGVRRLLVLGGSELNAQWLQNNLIDELFITIAPKVKLGRDVPTYADGVPLPRAQIQRYQVVECHVVNDEVFLRYRRDHEE